MMKLVAPCPDKPVERIRLSTGGSETFADKYIGGQDVRR
jgi:hypothetical protein